MQRADRLPWPTPCERPCADVPRSPPRRRARCGSVSHHRIGRSAAEHGQRPRPPSPARSRPSPASVLAMRPVLPRRDHRSFAPGPQTRGSAVHPLQCAPAVIARSIPTRPPRSCRLPWWLPRCSWAQSSRSSAPRHFRTWPTPLLFRPAPHPRPGTVGSRTSGTVPGLQGEGTTARHVCRSVRATVSAGCDTDDGLALAVAHVCGRFRSAGDVATPHDAFAPRRRFRSAPIWWVACPAKARAGRGRQGRARPADGVAPS